MDSSDSGTPSSRERIGAKQARRARQQSERERRRDRKRGGQPGHQGKGLARDPDPDENKDAEPPAECRQCKAALGGAQAASAVGTGHRRGGHPEGDRVDAARAGVPVRRDGHSVRHPLEQAGRTAELFTTKRSPRSTRPPAASPGPSTTSAPPPWSPPPAPARTSSTTPSPEPPSPKSPRQTEPPRDTPNTGPARPRQTGPFTSCTRSPAMTPPRSP
jgi:hypothetical protein